MRTGVGGGRAWWGWPLALLVLGVAAVPLVAHWLTNPADQRLVDLDVYRTGGESILLGLPVYDVMTPAPQLLPFTYPPVAALLAVPLALMSWPVAQWVWTAGVLLCLFVTVWHGFREPLSLARRPAWAAPALLGLLAVACLYLMPIRDQVRFGQVDILLVMLCAADCLARRPWWPRGLLIGLATAVKLTPGVFLILLLLTGFGPGARPEQRRAFFTAVLTTTLLTLLPFLVIPHDAAQFWFSALLDSERLGSNTGTTNQSIRGMLLRLYLPDWLTSVLWLALAGLVAWFGFRAARRALLGGDMLGAVALTGLMAVLVSPVAWIHHLAWVVVALAALAIPGNPLLTTAAPYDGPGRASPRDGPAPAPRDVPPLARDAGPGRAVASGQGSEVHSRAVASGQGPEVHSQAVAPGPGPEGHAQAGVPRRAPDTPAMPQQASEAHIRGVVARGASDAHGRAAGMLDDPAARIRLAVAAWIFYVVPVPWWGVTLRAAEIPVLSPVAGRIVQDAFGLGALVLVWLLARRTRSR
ncbi:glycosyltransferase 87 family protein [Sphaerisporangium sp. TRM90804]|uniref:glycosyltransferase 87 family protein n=1 Tax=Sphaerisporangium sp. TRM90804 TaxID=3031113 RepID=UPI0024491DC8|nr:glycosyltransferase 87 family protein [Sphaerisporangium sp. TRM90804]MDH2425702.1 glycosyltransferase 87 family protein [Sphaerisporangium sp. TRM90804]